MTYDAGPTVTFHRTDEGHLAARLEGYAMIAFPAWDGRAQDHRQKGERRNRA